jgi:hypothetical protein
MASAFGSSFGSAFGDSFGQQTTPVAGKWVEEIPKWIEDFPQWVENYGATTPQWVECGWSEFNPKWIDGPECPYDVEVPRQGFGWDTLPTNQRKKLLSQYLCLQAVLKCFTLIQGTGGYHNAARR